MTHIAVVEERHHPQGGSLRDQLPAAGHRVTVSPSLAEAAQSQAELVVARLNGKDMSAHVSKARKDLRSPLIVLIPPSQTSFLTMVELYEAGVDDCMTEPPAFAQLTASIAKLLPGAQAGSPLPCIRIACLARVPAGSPLPCGVFVGGPLCGSTIAVGHQRHDHKGRCEQ